MNGIEILSTKQELNFLRDAMIKNEFLGNGISRATYDLKNGFVVKITVDAIGQNQSDIECEMYNKYGSEFLAKVIYKGLHTIVSEYVTTYRRSEVRKFIEAYHDHKAPKDMSLTMCKMFDDTYNAVCKMMGDNGSEYMQLGVTIDGRVVAYDYGFDTNTERSLCSWALENKIDEITPNKLPKYVERLILQD